MQYFFEAVIYFFLIAAGAYIIESSLRLKRIVKHRLSLLVYILAIASWLIIFYGSFVEPRIIVVREQVVELGESGQVMRAVVIADPHLGPYKKSGWARDIVQMAKQQDPDVVFMVGDYVYNNSSQIDLFEPISELAEHYPVYAVTGNHDYTDNNIDYVNQSLKSWGIEVLANESMTVSIAGKEFMLAGVSDIWFDGNLSQTMKGLTEDQTVILLAHNPDVILSKITTLADLVVSGHTHAGQIRLPILGSVSPLPTILGRSHDLGLFQFDDEQLFISAGLGETGPRARLFNPPELSVLEIKW